MPRRCAFGCTPTVGVRHIFPHPTKFPEQFRAWVTILTGDPKADLEGFDHKSHVVCDRHFTDRDRNRGNRLNALAVPTLFLPEQFVNRPAAVEVILEPSVQSLFLINEEDISTCPSTEVPAVEENAAESSLSVQSTPLSSQVGTSSHFSKCSSLNILKHDHNYCATIDKVFKRPKRTWKPQSFVVKGLQRKIRDLNRQVTRLRSKKTNFNNRLDRATRIVNESSLKHIVKDMTKAAKIFTGMQFYQTKKKPKGRRFNRDEKILSLALYKRSPKCYGYLSKCFTLPSAKALKRLLSQVSLEEGINKLVFDNLRKIVENLSDENRLVTLIFDEMSLTPQVHFNSVKDEFKGFTSIGKKNIANHALVFMVKGIRKRFKQPVAYYFTNSLTKADLKKIVIDVASQVQKAGLTILCTVCDQSTTNVSTINELIEETRVKYIKKGSEMKSLFFEVNGKKVIPIYDTPHLLKGLRNNLLTKNLSFIDPVDNKAQTVKWDYFKMLYLADEGYGELKYLHNLTEEHIMPEKIKKMRVKTAAQVFSRSVAVAAKHMIQNGHLSKDCEDMINFVLTINNLFDSLNVSTLYVPNGKMYKGPIRRHSPHHQLWQTSIKMLKSARFISSKKVGNKIRLTESVVPTLTNFVKTIEGIQEIWKILSKKYLFDAMLTRNFNQDPIENFFGSIRTYGARNIAPNAVGFEGAYKSLLLNNLNSPHSRKSNCEEDDNGCLQNLDFFFNSTNQSIPTVPNEIPFKNVTIVGVDKDKGQRNYVCGWVLKKCLTRIVKNCKNCKKDIISHDRNENTYIAAKEFEIGKRWLCYPSISLNEYFCDVQNICVSHLKEDFPVKGIKSHIKSYIDIFTESPFKCETHKVDLNKYFVETTMNIIIYSL